jgi:YihY family inner membrane protein
MRRAQAGEPTPRRSAMSLKEHNIFVNLWNALKQFFKEDGLDKSSILAYYSIFSSLFLLTFFTFLYTKFLGDPDITLKSIYPFSPEFFSEISPDIFKRAAEISGKMKEVGVIGMLFSFILGFLVIKKIVQFVNLMFHIDLKDKRKEKHFLIRRISEFSLLFIIGLLVVVTFLFTGFISALSNLFHNNKYIASHINPHFLESVNSFLILYVVPFLITFLFFFVLYKWIPEKIVYVKGAFISAVICTILWELVKRGYALYLLNISIFGRIKGPIIAIILFGFWMELSMGIMLYGAKLTYIFDKAFNQAKEEKNEKEQKKNAKLKRAQSTG